MFSVLDSDVIGQRDGSISVTVQHIIDEACEIIVRGQGEKLLLICLRESRDPYKLWKKRRDRYAVVETAMLVRLLSRFSRLK